MQKTALSQLVIKQARDGDVIELHSNLGSTTFVTNIQPEKYIYDQSTQKCRKIPFSELHLQMVSKRVLSCQNPCKRYYGKHLDSILGKLPVCKNDVELQCFLDISKSTEDILTKNDALMKPCTKLQYSYKHISIANQHDSENSIPKNWA